MSLRHVPALISHPTFACPGGGTFHIIHTQGSHKPFRPPFPCNKSRWQLTHHSKRANTGWEETGADGKVKEKDAGKLMFCKMCGESSLSGRTIIQCDVCPAQWHCDCLDPPQANPPAVAQNGRTRGIFRCPLHVTQDLRLIGNPAFAYTKPDGSAVRGHKLRRPKQPRVIKPAIGRGLRNNGVVEVELEEPEEVTIQQEDGVVYRLTEQSIKLDFIERVKQ